MSLTNTQLANLLTSLVALLAAAHCIGYLFGAFRQPRVIGEILGGLLLGPSCLGFMCPQLEQILFNRGDLATLPALAAIYNLGLLFLMFCSGMEICSGFHSTDRKTVLAITFTGTALPFAAGTIFLQMQTWTEWQFANWHRFQGGANNDNAFTLVFSIALAVTSIPVIARIMFDLGILHTDFAKIVITAAVIEDICMYVILALAIGLVGHATASDSTIELLLGIDPRSGWFVVYHLLAPAIVVSGAILVRKRICSWLDNVFTAATDRSRCVGLLLLLLFTSTIICIHIGVVPMFGALVCGIAVGQCRNESTASALDVVKNVSFAFFVPVYFAIVGLKLDLVRHFDPLYFAAFLLFACFVKTFSVYLGARLAGEASSTARHLSVAMNARGGPGIVLASIAYDVGIINDSFYVILVMLAIVTSLFAGSYLGAVVAQGRPLR